MYRLSGFVLVCAMIIAPATQARQACASSVAELSAGLDRAEEQAQYARLAAQLDAVVSGGGPEHTAALTQLARAYYLLGEAEPVKANRLRYLDHALEASERALTAEPHNTIALYWRSMALLQKADIVGGLSALGMVKRALRDFEKVEAAEPAYDGAGAYRSHGKVLMEAPGWAFIGDKEKGVILLERAKGIAPRSLLNRLYLAQAYAGTGRTMDAVEELEYIARAPAGAVKQRDDLNIKEEAASLLKALRR